MKNMIRTLWPVLAGLVLLVTFNPIRMFFPPAMARQVPPPVLDAVLVSFCAQVNYQMNLVIILTGWTNTPPVTNAGGVLFLQSGQARFNDSSWLNPYMLQCSGAAFGPYTNTLRLNFSSGLSMGQTGNPVLSCQITALDGSQVVAQTVPNNGGVVYFSADGWKSLVDPRIVHARPADRPVILPESSAGFFRLAQ